MNTIIFDASKMFHAPLYNKAENDIISAGGGKMYAKKLITINILRILQGHSDAAHPISQKEIIKYLKDEYGMEVDRKAVRRNIDFLIDAGYEIKPASPEKKRMMPNGETGEKEEQPLITDIYLVRDFSDAELRMLIDSVLFSGHIPHSQRKELAEKLESLSSKYFRSHMKHVLTVPDNLPENPQLFLNIELLGEAIYEGRKVSFQYLEYGVDKKLHPKLREDGSVREYVVNPYQMAAKEGKYYLICNYDKYDGISNYRVDRITKVEKLDEPVKPFESLPWAKERRLDLAKYMREHIYMFSSENVRAKFRIVKPMISDVIDMFGKEVRFSDETDDTVTVTATVNEMSMLQFARSFAPDVVLLEPEFLAKKVKETAERTVEAYKDI